MAAFNYEYESFPSDETYQTLVKEGRILPKGTTANHYFGQLLASNISDWEAIFTVHGKNNTKKPDKIFNTSKTVLSREENGFGYVMQHNGKAIISEAVLKLR